MTLKALRDRITGELVRDDLSDAANLAILDSIRYYEREPWGFNETQTALIATSQRLEFPSGFMQDEYIKVRDNGSYHKLGKLSYAQIEERQYNNEESGCPEYYAVFGDTFWLWPNPDETYSVFVSYLYSLPDLTADSDSNAWTGEMEELIRMRAKADLCENRLQGQEAAMEAAKYRMREREVYTQLRARRTLQRSTNRIRRRGIL